MITKVHAKPYQELPKHPRATSYYIENYIDRGLFWVTPVSNYIELSSMPSKSFASRIHVNQGMLKDLDGLVGRMVPAYKVEDFLIDTYYSCLGWAFPTEVLHVLGNCDIHGGFTIIPRASNTTLKDFV